MATEKNISNASRNPKIQDPAVAAARRMEAAGENDVAYNRAVDSLISAQATTAAGIREQMKYYRVLAQSVMDGDELTPTGEAQLFSFGATIVAGLDRLAIS